MSEKATGCGNNRKKYIAWDHLKKKKRLVRIIVRLFTIIAKKKKKKKKKTYLVESKGHSTIDLLNQVPNCVKNPNRDALKEQQTLVFEPKMDGVKGFQLVPIAFTVETSRKALIEMVIIDKFPFRFVEAYRFQRFLTTL